MADKPSRSLVIYGDGHASLLTPSHSNLHSFSSLAYCGFLSLRLPPPDEPEAERQIRELAQLLDAYDFYLATNKKPEGDDSGGDSNEIETPIISKRFMGMKAALFSSCPSAVSFAKTLGFSARQTHELVKPADELQEVPPDSVLAAELLNLLGFSGGEVLDESDFDLVFLHAKTGEKVKGHSDVDWIDKLVGEIMQKAQPGSDVASRLHFSVVLSHCADSGNEKQCSLIANSLKGGDSDLSILRPRQSYTMKGGKTLDDIRHHHPMLIAQWQEGVTRKDFAKAFSFDEFKENGANLAILADRFLHEVAFKLWRAPKYGA